MLVPLPRPLEPEQVELRAAQRAELAEWMQAVDVEPGRIGETLSDVMLRVAVATKRHTERALASAVTREVFDSHTHRYLRAHGQTSTGSPEREQ